MTPNAKKLASKLRGFFGLTKMGKMTDELDQTDGTGKIKIAIPNNSESEKLPWTFEVSWDVVDNVDQICTINGEKNILIGPYRPHRVLDDEIYETDFPAGSLPAMAVEAIRAQGIQVITGKWKVRKLPPGILFNIESARNKVGNEYIKKFKRENKIHIPDGDLEGNDAVVFGYIIAEFLANFESLRSPLTTNNDQERSSEIVRDLDTCAQFHDWKCGIGLILVHKLKIPITKIFTLNTSLLKGNFESHEQAKEEALHQGIHHRFSVEHAAIQSADIFSPVSKRVARQAEVVHQREPDFVIIRMA